MIFIDDIVVVCVRDGRGFGGGRGVRVGGGVGIRMLFLFWYVGDVFWFGMCLVYKRYG